MSKRNPHQRARAKEEKKMAGVVDLKPGEYKEVPKDDPKDPEPTKPETIEAKKPFYVRHPRIAGGIALGLALIVGGGIGYGVGSHSGKDSDDEDLIGADDYPAIDSE